VSQVTTLLMQGTKNLGVTELVAMLRRCDAVGSTLARERGIESFADWTKNDALRSWGQRRYDHCVEDHVHHLAFSVPVLLESR
jgi:hypothetical protein